MTVIAATAGGVIAAMGIAAASTPGHTADVTYVPLSVPKKILSNVSIGKAATNSPLVIGGSTTVPTDATSVQLTVAVKSTAAGSLAVFPADRPGSSTADTIAFPAGNVVATRTTRQNPGLNSKISITNNGTAAAVVTVTITGYSAQTTASNVSGSGGNPGQVLTNTGAGATWQNPTAGGPAGGALTGTYPNPGLGTSVVGNGNLANNAVTTGKISAAGSASGQVLTSTGGSVVWANPKVPGYQILTSPVLTNPAHSQTLGGAFCPAGKAALGGGVLTSSRAPGTQSVNSSGPSGGGAAWFAYVDNTGDSDQTFTVYAVCASA